MTPHSVPIVVIAAITAYVGAYHLFIYIRRPQSRRDLMFSFVCLAIALYDVFSIGLYNATSPLEGQPWQRGQILALHLIGVAFVLFSFDYTPAKSRKLGYGFIAYFAIVGMVQLIAGKSKLFWLDEPSIKKVSLPFSTVEITYLEMTPGPFFVITTVFGLLLWLHFLLIGVNLCRRGDTKQGIPLIVVVFLFLVGFINDTLVNTGTYAFPYIIEYCFVSMVVVVAYSLSEELVAATRIRERLRASEETINALAETSQDWIWSIDLQAAHTYSNAAVERILGYTQDEIVGHSSLHLMHLDDRQKVQDTLAQSIEEKCGWQNLLVRWRHKDGSWRYLESNAVPIFNAEGQLIGFQGVDRDITQRRQAEEALREKEKRYRMLFESATDAIFLIKDSRFVDCNPKALDIFGAKREQIIGTEPHTLSPTDQPDGRNSQEKARTKLNAALAGRPQSFEWRHTRCDGTPFDAEVSLSRLDVPEQEFLLALVRDVTERNRMEQDRSRLATAIECAGEGIALVGLNTQIEYVNSAFEQITGYSREEIVGNSVTMLEDDLQGVSFYEDVWKAVKPGDAQTGRVESRRKDGTTCQTDVTVSPVYDQSASVTGYICVYRDVSDQLALEARVRQTQKMEAMGVLAGGIAHDFNNILSAILGYTDLAIEDTGKDGAVYASLVEVAKAGERAADLVAQILAFSRQTEHERKPLRLHTVAKEAVKLLRGSIPPTVDICEHMDDSCDPVMADPDPNSPDIDEPVHQRLPRRARNGRGDRPRPDASPCWPPRSAPGSRLETWWIRPINRL